MVGDTGTGSQAQYEVAAQLVAFHGAFPFEFVILMGDNIYGADRPADMAPSSRPPTSRCSTPGSSFARPSATTTTRTSASTSRSTWGASATTHSGRTNGGTSKLAEAACASSPSTPSYLDEAQLHWLEKELSSSRAEWKIAFFHHPLYSSGRAHGPSLESRAVLEPLFVKYGVSVAFSGHDHFYERIKPQKGGIVYWVSGAGGSLRKGDIRART